MDGWMDGWMDGFSYSERLEAVIDRPGEATESIAFDRLTQQLHLTLAHGDLAVIAQAIRPGAKQICSAFSID